MSTSVNNTILPFFGIIRVSGRDHVSFLHNQLSNDINNLAQDHACFATYNTPKGRVIANMIIIKQKDDCLIITAENLIDKLINKLRMYVLRSHVVFEKMDNLVITTDCQHIPSNPYIATQPTLSFPVSNHQTIPLPEGSVLSIVEKTPDLEINTAVLTQWQQHEIRSGYPWIDASTSETCVAQMLNLHNIGGIHFKKGCYPGQEIIARAQYRGQVKRGLATISCSSQLNNGENLVDDQGEEVGIIINTVHSGSQYEGLAVIKYHAVNQTIFTTLSENINIEHVFFNQND